MKTNKTKQNEENLDSFGFLGDFSFSFVLFCYFETRAAYIAHTGLKLVVLLLRLLNARITALDQYSQLNSCLFHCYLIIV